MPQKAQASLSQQGLLEQSRSLMIESLYKTADAIELLDELELDGAAAHLEAARSIILDRIRKLDNEIQYSDIQ